MAQLPGTAEEIRARVPPVLEAWEFMRDNVLRDGLIDPELKRLCFRYLAEDPNVMDFDRYSGRERLALEWAYAIAWDSDAADDELWARLHAEFTEPELVELGCSIGFALGQQHWERTLGLPATAGLS
jgi:alkylhydroperoxidase family enzyme